MSAGGLGSPLPVPIDLNTVGSRFDPDAVTTGDLIFAAIAVVSGIVLGSIARAALRRALRDVDGIPIMAADVIGRVVQYVLLTLGFVVALELLGFSSGLMGGVILLLLVLVVLAVRPLLQDLGAGMIIQLRRPFAVDDQIVVDGESGRVDEVSARTVRLISVDGRRIHLPNRMVLERSIVNLTTEGARMSTFVAGVEYSTDLDRAREVIASAVAEAPGVLDDPAPEAFVEEFADSTINIACRFWHQPQIQAEWSCRDEAMRSAKRALDASGITIAFPQRVLWNGDDTSAGDR